MIVPLLDLKPQNEALHPELRAAFERVLASNQFILGPEVQDFEQRCAGIAGVKHAIGVSSGTDAILLALMALGIGPGHEVICPSFTFFATAGCIARTGARPVFADSSPGCFNLDVEDARKRISPRTKAIIPVHLFGQMAEMDGVMELAREHGLFVIEDAAQSFGASYHGRPAGSIGHFATFSFFPSKNLGGYGDSGMLVSNDDNLAAKARLLRTHGAEQKYFHKYVGGNFRIDALQAALLAVKLGHLEEYSNRRANNAAHYTSHLAAIPGIRQASCDEPDVNAHILLPFSRKNQRHIWNQYTLRVTNGNRDRFRSHLQAHGIASEVYYPRPMHLQECFAVCADQPLFLPICERLAGECVSIPVFPELTPDQRNHVVDVIASFVDGIGE